MGMAKRFELSVLLLLIVAFSQCSRAVDARPTTLQYPQRYSKLFATLGVVCECCDGGLRRDSAHTGSLRKQDMGSQYGNAKHGTPDNTSQRSKGEGSGIASKDRHSIYQNGTTEPCYFSSSIYYGGQEMYSPTGQTTGSQHIFKKDGGEEDDPNGNNVNSASRGNWWQGMIVVELQQRLFSLECLCFGNTDSFNYQFCFCRITLLLKPCLHVMQSPSKNKGMSIQQSFKYLCNMERNMVVCLKLSKA
ncbi:hypothetical protein F0562_031654 [Nyssa sinensis]|uniref:Uncharacterized protein n=1 Tax=Nyssa sinensis TaxID=561372 RepID=A0A5J5AT84_9ASTE|nr:hypothetical protein F0562_031654 [Nyssa sinensis]